MSTHTRKVAALAATGLIGTVLPLVALGGTAAHAADPCEHEYNPVPPLNISSAYTCDDTTQPDTTALAAPVANPAGWVSTKSVTFTFAAVAPGDPDLASMTLRCSLTGPSQAFAEKDCTSPLTVNDLEDSLEAYTFTVHAVDDGGLTELNGDNEVTKGPFDFTTPDEVVTKDYDESPATVSFKVDTKAPRGLLVGGPYDDLTPEFPVLWSTSTSYTVGSSEQPVSAACQLNTASVPCQVGKVNLTGLTAGPKTFSLRLTDPAGNTDPILRTKRFTVPFNTFGSATQRQKWKRVLAPGYVGGDYLETRVMGATLSKQVSFTELRLMVPRGPGLGSFRIKVGDYYFKIVNQAASTPSNQVLVLRRVGSAPMSGLLKIFTLSNKPVRFDAIMYR